MTRNGFAIFARDPSGRRQGTSYSGVLELCWNSSLELALSGSVQFVQSVVDGVVKVFGYFARWWLG